MKQTQSKSVLSQTDQILAMIRQLSPRDRLHLIARVLPELDREWPLRMSSAKKSGSKKSIYGLWGNLGIDLSAEDIDQARQEMWGSFPRESIQ